MALATTSAMESIGLVGLTFRDQGADAVAHAIFKKVNVDGTRAVVSACQQAAVKALVYTSSASVMSDNRSDLINASEEWPVIRGSAQSEYYSETKVSKQ